jgi:uncharacterized protein (TIGR00290 family)
MKVAVLWSGGKDSSLACYKAIKNKFDVDLIVTFIWENPSLAHPLSVIKLQSKALQIPFFWAKVTAPYFEAYRETISELKKEYGIEGVVTGDIAYVDSFHGNWIGDVCKGTGVEVIKPLWGLNRSQILEELIGNGFKVIFTCVKQPWFDEKWVGRMLDAQSMKDLKELNEKYGMDMCGEMGEYHTMTLYGPIFKRAVQISEFTKEKIDNSFIMEPTKLSLPPE